MAAGSVLIDYLRAAGPGGATSEEIARDVLAMTGPPAIVGALAAKVLAGRDDVVAGPGGRWRPAAANAAAVTALVVVATGPSPSLDALVLVAAARREPDGRETRWSSFVRPERTLGATTLERLAVTQAQLAGGLAVEATLEQLRSLLAGARPVCWRRDSGVAWVDARLGLSTLALAPTLRHAGVPARSLADAAAALGVPVPVSELPADRASAVLGLAVASSEREVALEPPPPPPRFDFSGVDFDTKTLDALPDGPGVYRFYDRAGELLYVGKARDLRSRVWSYFVHRDARRKRYAELMARLWRLEFEETGSELTALLTELKQIRERRPSLNVQLEVHERREATGTFALFLPGRGEHDIDLLLLARGRPVGRATIDRRRGRGMREVRALLRAALFGATPPPEGDAAEGQIVASWLARYRDRQNLVDLSGCGTRSDAARLIRDYALDPDLFRAKVFR